jgi:hypothetical protein
MLQRFDDWPQRLDRFLRDQSGKEFHYGSFDCCTFASAAVEAMTGVDPAKSYRHRYMNRKEAHAILRQHGGLARMLIAAGFQQIPASEARRGDLAFVRRGLLGVVTLDGMHVIVIGEQGKLPLVPLAQASCAWRI